MQNELGDTVVIKSFPSIPKIPSKVAFLENNEFYVVRLKRYGKPDCINGTHFDLYSHKTNAIKFVNAVSDDYFKIKRILLIESFWEKKYFRTYYESIKNDK